MSMMHDIVCQVYAGRKSMRIIEKALYEFLPQHEALEPGYAMKPGYGNGFQTESEMLNYFIDRTGLQQTFYWNQYTGNPDKIMLGADITYDDQLIISLTFNGDVETQETYFRKLKQILNSDIGAISHQSF